MIPRSSYTKQGKAATYPILLGVLPIPIPILYLSLFHPSTSHPPLHVDRVAGSDAHLRIDRCPVRTNLQRSFRTDPEATDRPFRPESNEIGKERT